MTARKPDARVQLPPFVPRTHYACRLRNDLWEALKQRCHELNCSQGVFLEVALSKVLVRGFVQSSDVFEYDASERCFHSMLDQLEREEVFYGRKVSGDELERARAVLEHIVADWRD